MRIIFTLTNTELDSLALALKHANFNVSFWINSNKPTYDMFTETQPDLVITTPKHVDLAMADALADHKTKLVVLGNDTNNRYLQEIMGIMSAYSQAITCILSPLKYEVELPKHLIELPKFADTTNFFPVKPNPKCACDLACLNATKEQVDMFLEAGFSVKTFGTSLTHPNYLGTVSSGKIREIFSSAKLGFMGNTYNVTANGCCPILPTETSIENSKEYVKNDKLRKKHNKDNLQFVLDSHTCFHRMATIFQSLDMQFESNQLLDTAKKYHETRYSNR